ncbi:MAG: DNA polymerase III subunit chi [Albidovulum sp.]|nr:DNA polymerase III subunit chi [Albidovulum sp.]
MPDVKFYQTNRGHEFAVRLILAKSREMGWRILVRGTKQDRIERLDDFLWKVPEDDFLPHGVAGGDHDELQPILLTAGSAKPDSRETLVLLDGAATSSAELETKIRVSVVFESRDSEVVRIARSQWKSFRDQGCSLEYWSEEGGGWTKKAST